jgi:hypothetical protein
MHVQSNHAASCKSSRGGGDKIRQVKVAPLLAPEGAVFVDVADPLKKQFVVTNGMLYVQVCSSRPQHRGGSPAPRQHFLSGGERSFLSGGERAFFPAGR